MLNYRLAFVLFALAVFASACGGSPTAPSSAVPPESPVTLHDLCEGKSNRITVTGIKPGSGTMLRDGDPITFSYIGEKSKGEYGVAHILVRDDGEKTGLGGDNLASSCDIQRSSTSVLYGSHYAFAKKHVVSIEIVVGEFPLYDYATGRVIEANVKYRTDIGGDWLVE